MKAQPITHYGLTIRPSYISPRGTGAVCTTVQGYYIDIPGTTSQWESTKREAIAAVEYLRELWGQGNPSRTERAKRLMDLWGRNVAHDQVDKAIAAAETAAETTILEKLDEAIAAAAADEPLQKSRLIDELLAELKSLVDAHEKLLVESRTTEGDAKMMTENLPRYTGNARAVISRAESCLSQAWQRAEMGQHQSN